MGRRSRKRAPRRAAPAAGEGARRAERDGNRRERARRTRSEGERKRRRGGRNVAPGDRPPPLWGAFPLTELVILGGIVLMVWGFLSGATTAGSAKLAAGLAIASVAGLELAIREHVTGFRSHTTLLSGAVAILAILALGLGAGLDTLGVLLGAGAAAFAGSFVCLRGLFRRRSGGFSFR